MDIRAAGYVAFAGNQVLAFDSNIDRLTETVMESVCADEFEVRAVTQRVLDAIESGEDCLRVTLADHGFDGKVYDLA